MSYHLTVNGVAFEVAAPGMRRLLDVLREDLGLTGTKEGCGEGECGACTVLLDGAVVDSCLVPLCQADGHDVRTVEGLAASGARADRVAAGRAMADRAPAIGPPPNSLPELAPLQKAFLERGGAQCGICTPGMLMAAEAFLASGAAPTDEAIRTAIAGNLCRCTGYTKIVESIALAAEWRAASSTGSTSSTASTGSTGA